MIKRISKIIILEKIIVLILILSKTSEWSVSINRGSILITEEKMKMLIGISIVYSIVIERIVKKSKVKTGEKGVIVILLLSETIKILVLLKDMLSMYIIIEITNIIMYVIMCKSSRERDKIKRYILMSIINSILIILYVILGEEYIIIYSMFKLGIYPYSYYINELYSSLNNKIIYIKDISYKIIYMYIISKEKESKIIKLLYKVLGILSIVYSSKEGIKYINISNMLGNSSIMNSGIIIMMIGKSSLEMIKVYIILYIVNLVNIMYILSRRNWKENEGTGRESIVMGISILSLIGYPPLVGYYNKIGAINILYINNGKIEIISIIIGSVISSLYYMYYIINEVKKKVGKKGKVRSIWGSISTYIICNSYMVNPVLWGVIV